MGGSQDLITPVVRNVFRKKDKYQLTNCKLVMARGFVNTEFMTKSPMVLRHGACVRSRSGDPVNADLQGAG